MNKFLIVAFSFFSFVASELNTNLNLKEKSDCMTIQSQTTYYIIRHAEKAGKISDRDPELSEVGITRTENWTKYFSEITFDEIYSTNYKRTMATATPVAESKNLEIKNYNPNEILTEDFKTSTRGKTILVVGHSNTIPFLANYFLNEQKYQELDESEYSWLYIVTIDENGKAVSERRKIE